MKQTPSLVRPWQSRGDVTSGGPASSIWIVDMAGCVTTTSSEPRQRAPGEDLLLREMNHRWSNDLQLVVGLLALQGKRAANSEVRQALRDAMERVSILSRARSAMFEQQHSLETALRQVREALHVQAELRLISISLEVRSAIHGLSEQQVTTLALVVNELTTNAIKHAFAERMSGRIWLSIGTNGGEVTVTVDDDGLPLAEAARGPGVGMGLVKRLMASIGGVLIPPPLGTKVFELRVPVVVH